MKFFPSLAFQNDCATLKLKIEELKIAKGTLATREEERKALVEKKHTEQASSTNNNFKVFC